MINQCMTECFYNVYGLIVKSEIKFWQLSPIVKPGGVEEDVHIYYGKVPRIIEGAVINNKVLQISTNKIYFYINNVAHYFIANGDTIIVEPDDESSDDRVNAYILGGSLGAILMQRNTIAIHGGAVAVEDKGVIISGPPGAGKSTLLSAFRKEGYSLLADDISPIERYASGKIMIQPAYAQQKLCRDSAEKLGYKVEELYMIDPSRDKYALTFNDNFLSNPVNLHSIFEIGIGEDCTVQMYEVFGNERLRLILRNIYQVSINNRIGFNAIYFKKCLDIAQTVSVYKIKRPRGIFSVGEQLKLIKSTL